ncbi:MAG: class I SAM-dependent methyltransferase [Gammaproteobacteria bacterium]|nr:class I SAM-dependent methyltransferase [Gammaproteobacteria bacterium]
MRFYDEYILPHVINCACGLNTVCKQREKVVPQASGRVLEVGIGSALNLPYYQRSEVEFIWGLEPSAGMRAKAQKNLDAADVAVKWLDLPGESIPLANDSADTVLLTYTLCTIPDWQAALAEMRRVLKPDGKLLFCEHGLAPSEKVQRWQQRITPFWKKIAGGCHLDRNIPALLQAAGFRMETLEAGYIKGPRIAAFNYWGRAV